MDNYDEERVYASDIKKVIQWYNILLQNKLISVTKTKATKKVEKPTPKTPSKKSEE